MERDIICPTAESTIVHVFIAHARNGHISTSGLKSDVTVVFLDPISYKTLIINEYCIVLYFGDSQTFEAIIGLFVSVWISGPLGLKSGFRGKTDGLLLTPNEPVLTLWVITTVPNNSRAQMSIAETVAPRRQHTNDTDCTQVARNSFISFQNRVTRSRIKTLL